MQHKILTHTHTHTQRIYMYIQTYVHALGHKEGDTSKIILFFFKHTHPYIHSYLLI